MTIRSGNGAPSPFIATTDSRKDDPDPAFKCISNILDRIEGALTGFDVSLYIEHSRGIRMKATEGSYFYDRLVPRPSGKSTYHRCKVRSVKWPVLTRDIVEVIKKATTNADAACMEQVYFEICQEVSHYLSFCLPSSPPYIMWPFLSGIEKNTKPIKCLRKKN